MNLDKTRIVILGGAGLVGQNLVAQLVAEGLSDLVVIDKHQNNLAVLAKLHKSVVTVCADLSEEGEWANYLKPDDIVVMLQAQIGGNDLREFERNNIKSTLNVISSMRDCGISRLIHLSSSVVESVANDWYTTTKKAQEDLVNESGLVVTILRPTLMFGWFDRKHLGWLSRFMKKSPIFPIPGSGRYMRQPLYAGDLSRIVVSCIRNKDLTGTYNISGREEIDYIDIIRNIKHATKAKIVIVKIPKKAFELLLWVWAIFDKNPPFTTQQLRALTAHDEFEVIDWPMIFSVSATSFQDAVNSTFNHPEYSEIVLEF